MPKTKLSVTVDSHLIRQVDRATGGGNRSEAVEKALLLWLREFRSTKLEQEVESYYHSLSGEEQVEDAQWADLGAASLGDSAP